MDSGQRLRELVSFLFSVYFLRQGLYMTLAILELVDQACSELRYDYFCLMSVGIKGVHHHAKLSQVGQSRSVNHNSE